MSKRAAAAQEERQKVQLVSCPCCEARLALHFIHGSKEIYDVELVAPSSRKKDDDDDGNIALDATTITYGSWIHRFSTSRLLDFRCSRGVMSTASAHKRPLVVQSCSAQAISDSASLLPACTSTRIAASHNPGLNFDRSGLDFSTSLPLYRNREHTVGHMWCIPKANSMADSMGTESSPSPRSSATGPYEAAASTRNPACPSSTHDDFENHASQENCLIFPVHEEAAVQEVVNSSSHPGASTNNMQLRTDEAGDLCSSLQSRALR